MLENKNECNKEWGVRGSPYYASYTCMHELNTSRLTTEMEQAFADSIVCSSVCLGGGQKKRLN